MSMGWDVCPWTATTNGPIVNHQLYKYEEPQWNNTDRGNRKIRIKPAPMPLCPPQIPHGLTARPATNHLSHSTAFPWTHETTYYFIKPSIRSAYWTGEQRARDNPVVRFCDGNDWLTSNCIPLSPDYIYQWSINRFPRRNTKPLAFRLNFSEVPAFNTKLFFLKSIGQLKVESTSWWPHAQDFLTSRFPGMASGLSSIFKEISVERIWFWL
jgi:hypothetical protein